MLVERTAGIAGRGHGLFVTSIVMVALAGIFVGSRLIYRAVTRRVGWDDWTILMSLTLSIVLTTTMCMSINNGFGPHCNGTMTHRSISAQHVYESRYYFAQVVYKPIIGLTKASILASYLRIFTVSKKFNIICWINVAVIVSWTIGTTVATILQCVPVRASWDKSVKAKCIDSDAFWLAYGGMNIATDVIILLLPIQPIMKLKMRAREKIGLLLAFLVGAFVVLTSILRVVAVKASTANKADTTWAFVPRATWTLVEVNIAILCACLPALRKPLMSLVSSQKLFTISNESQEASLNKSIMQDSGVQLGATRYSRSFPHKPILVTKEYEVLEYQDPRRGPARDPYF
ncbi:WD repeat-containing protein 21 [Sphaceloma murrayae]|uniref:WD repeat-containing protein 21 n=1 Tax=Sphaceloma murrayae TaxID=2082308 RepID=A0A2K1QSA8_9PEZI|nr:WD repeat-containing protein 21 [Sphaceloma murrayae]